MRIWAIADLHLSYGTPNKKMDVFGPEWDNHGEKIAENWRNKISNDDLVLIAGDISWAMKLDDAQADLDWIDQLPGTKVMIRGNHDYWWQSVSKMKKVLPSSIHIIQNDAFNWHGASVGGARLWDDQDFHFIEYIDIKGENSLVEKLKTSDEELAQQEKIFQRELGRLELSLKAMDPNAKVKIVMTHYPPLSADLQDSRTTQLLEKYGVQYCLFGHLHSLKKGMEMFGEKNGIHYINTACDFLGFDPIPICEV